MCKDLWNWQSKNPWGFGERDGELQPRKYKKTAPGVNGSS